MGNKGEKEREEGEGEKPGREAKDTDARNH